MTILFALISFISFNATEYLEEIKERHYHQPLLCFSYLNWNKEIIVCSTIIENIILLFRDCRYVDHCIHESREGTKKVKYTGKKCSHLG